MATRALTTDDLLFVSFNGKVIAVDRLDGSIVWKWKASKSTGLVVLLPSGDRLFVSINGYTVAILATMRNGVSDAAVTGGFAVSSSDGGDGGPGD